jgi:very-short-patch-repair endonuclease
MVGAIRDENSSPPRSGGEVARAQPETERGTSEPGRRSPQSLARARELRHGDNMAEAVIWNELKAGRLGGHKFVRQMPLGPYFADFVCRKDRLVVELDGSQHADNEYDRRRDEYMRAQGYSVLRFWSHEAIKQTAAVCNTILAVLEGRLTDRTDASDLRFFPARLDKRR